MVIFIKKFNILSRKLFLDLYIDINIMLIFLGFNIYHKVIISKRCYFLYKDVFINIILLLITLSWTGFYMIVTSVMKNLICLLYSAPSSLNSHIVTRKRIGSRIFPYYLAINFTTNGMALRQ